MERLSGQELSHVCFELEINIRLSGPVLAIMRRTRIRHQIKQASNYVAVRFTALKMSPSSVSIKLPSFLFSGGGQECIRKSWHVPIRYLGNGITLGGRLGDVMQLFPLQGCMILYILMGL